MSIRSYPCGLHLGAPLQKLRVPLWALFCLSSGSLYSFLRWDGLLYSVFLPSPWRIWLVDLVSRCTLQGSATFFFPSILMCFLSWNCTGILVYSSLDGYPELQKLGLVVGGLGVLMVKEMFTFLFCTRSMGSTRDTRSLIPHIPVCHSSVAPSRERPLCTYSHWLLAACPGHYFPGTTRQFAKTRAQVQSINSSSAFYSQGHMTYFISLHSDDNLPTDDRPPGYVPPTARVGATIQAGDLLVSNHTSALEVLYFASRFLPLFTGFSLAPEVCKVYKIHIYLWSRSMCVCMCRYMYIYFFDLIPS